MMAKTKLLAGLLAALALSAAAPLPADELITLETRPGVTQQFILIESAGSVANIILFPGGHGNLGLQARAGKPSMDWGRSNFVVRTRSELAKKGFNVAVVDAPSDRKGKKGMLGGFRDSNKHVKDIDRVIGYLRKRYNLTVWLIGTSRGTESAARVAISSTKNPNGLVLTSSMTRPNKGGTPVTRMELDRVTAPALILAHRNDGCRHTPAAGAEEIKQQLVNASKVEIRYFTGGKKPKSGPCKASSAHGFYGIEHQVLKTIAEFIKTDS